MNPVMFRPDQIHNGLSPFLIAQIDKILKILSLQINIANTNENVFPMLYTCINYNPPMNSVKFYTCIYYNPSMNPYNLQQSFYPVGDTIALAIYLFALFPIQIRSYRYKLVWQ